MRIALCLSGEIRTLEHCYHTIEEAFPESKVDIFATIWDRDVEKFNDLNVIEPKTLQVIQQDHPIVTKLHDFEKQILSSTFEVYKGKVIDTWKPLPIYMLPRVELMARNSFNLIADRKTEYDYIVRSRYDHRYLRDVTELFESHKILVTEDIGGSAPWDTIMDYRCVYDGFAASSPMLMELYYKFTDWLPNYYDDPNINNHLLKAESTLGYYLNGFMQLPMKYTNNILGMQISEDDFYLRGKEPKDVTIKTKRAVTLKQYKDTIKSNHPDVYEKYNVEEMLCA